MLSIRFDKAISELFSFQSIELFPIDLRWLNGGHKRCATFQDKSSNPAFLLHIQDEQETIEEIDGYIKYVKIHKSQAIKENGAQVKSGELKTNLFEIYAKNSCTA